METTHIEMDQVSYTYGVEIEAVLAYHESLLQPYLDEGEKLVKALPLHVRSDKAFNVMYPDITRPYNSWGVFDRTKTIPFVDQPLLIAQKILEAHTGDTFEIYAHARMIQKHNNRYKTWHVTADHTVRGVGPKKLLEHLPTRINRHENNKWDSFGIEVVTPVFNTADDRGIQAIQDVLDCLKGTNSSIHGALVTEQAGLHIHIGAPEDLGTLKELAYLTIIYEDEISRLHPLRRKAGHPHAGYIKSNRLSFLDSTTLQSLLHDGHLDTSPEHDDIRSRIRATTSHAELVALMCPDGSRDYLVNWQYVVYRGEEYPRTVEFRQHCGTLNIDDIKWWLYFVTGLVKLAGKRRTAPPQEQSKLRPSIYQLLFELEFPEEGRTYLEERMLEYCLAGERQVDAKDLPIMESKKEALECRQKWEDEEEERKRAEERRWQWENRKLEWMDWIDDCRGRLWAYCSHWRKFLY